MAVFLYYEIKLTSRKEEKKKNKLKSSRLILRRIAWFNYSIISIKFNYIKINVCENYCFALIISNNWLEQYKFQFQIIHSSKLKHCKNKNELPIFVSIEDKHEKRIQMLNYVH